jgi:SAM-dependent methyltransferase
MIIKYLSKSRSLRNYISWAARNIHFLQGLDFVCYNFTKVRNFLKNRQFIMENPGFPVPPSHLAYDAYNTILWDEYYRSGLKVAEYLSELLRTYLGTQEARVLEWGCGPARIIRHLPKVLGHGAEIFGSDYNKETIFWCTENIEGVTFVENKLCPPLPYGNDSFDCVYGFSVLTHLSEKMCKAWVKELTRLTKRDGLILLSTKGEIQQARLLPEERRRLLNKKPIFRGKVVEGSKMYDTILPTEYVKKELLSGIELIRHIPGQESSSHHEQDLYIIRKP